MCQEYLEYLNTNSFVKIREYNEESFNNMKNDVIGNF